MGFALGYVHDDLGLGIEEVIHLSQETNKSKLESLEFQYISSWEARFEIKSKFMLGSEAIVHQMLLVRRKTPISYGPLSAAD